LGGSSTARASAELTIVLPLGVVANQLMRIEADLRVLNMKALAWAKERENGEFLSPIAARLDKINEALDLIRTLVSDIRADIEPKPPAATVVSKQPPARDD
jgi:hypothetical protein